MLTGMLRCRKWRWRANAMSVPLLSGDQEEEQSCFSDTSADDLRFNGMGIEHVYYARLHAHQRRSDSGPSLADLVRKTDPRTADEMERDCHAHARRLARSTLHSIAKFCRTTKTVAHGAGRRRCLARADAVDRPRRDVAARFSCRISKAWVIEVTQRFSLAALCWRSPLVHPKARHHGVAGPEFRRCGDGAQRNSQGICPARKQR